MLIINCRNDRNKSKYKCDRCGKECFLHEKRGVYIENDLGRAVKAWDLCLRCYKALKRGMETRK